ncbi:MAG: hypothetical protein R2838_04260 [Caldilineaceae bacterium]
MVWRLHVRPVWSLSGDGSSGDLGVSFFQFPTPVNELIATGAARTATLL